MWRNVSDEKDASAKDVVKEHCNAIKGHIRALHKLERREDSADLLKTLRGWETHGDDCNKISLIVDRIRRRFV